MGRCRESEVVRLERSTPRPPALDRNRAGRGTIRIIVLFRRSVLRIVGRGPLTVPFRLTITEVITELKRLVQLGREWRVRCTWAETGEAWVRQANATRGPLINLDKFTKCPVPCLPTHRQSGQQTSTICMVWKHLCHHYRLPEPKGQLKRRDLTQDQETQESTT